MIRPRLSVAALALLGLASGVRAQVVTWGGGFPNDKFSYATNWYGGVVPGSGDTLAFNDNSDSALKIDVGGVSVAGITATSSMAQGGTQIQIGGSHPLTLGALGVSAVSDGSNESSQVGFLTSVILSASQTWSQADNPQGDIWASGAISGAFALTLAGDGTNPAVFQLYSGASTFSGGLTVAGHGTAVAVGSSSVPTSGTVTSGPVGTGTLTLGDGTTLTTTTGGTVTLGNALVVGDQSNTAGVAFGGPTSQSNPGNTSLVLTGPVTLNDSDLEIDAGHNSSVTFSGALTGYAPGVCLDFGSANAGAATNGYVIVQGSITNVSRLDLEDNVSVILDGAGASQLSTLEDIGFEGGGSPYLGFGSAYAGSVATALGYLYGPGFEGTLGLDTTSGPTATFADAIDLTNFPAPGGSFVGLGSATSAILTGVITPPGGATGTSYPFGGGGGMLTVVSALIDGSFPRSLTLSAGNAPLTLVLSGALDYSGGTQVKGGVLIFDSAPPATGQVSLSSGYVGVTANAGFTDGMGTVQNFITLMTPGATAGVIGFDSLAGQQQVASSIIMSGMGTGVYLGTATSVNYSGPITPNGTAYQFAGVKGGQVTVSHTLGGANAVVVGLPTPIENMDPLTGYVSQSTVTLAAANYYSGGTTLNSGYLDVTNFNSLGSGPLTVPDPPSARNGWAATLAASGGPVTLANPISVSGAGLALNTASSSLLTLTSAIGNYINGEVTDNGSLGIFGPVDLEGNNTFTGGVFIDAQGATVTVGTDTGLGLGQISANNAILDFTSANPVLGSATSSQQQVSLSGTTANFSGYPALYGLWMQGSTLHLNGPGAYVDGLNDSPTSLDAIALGSGTALTIDLGGYQDSGSGFHGVISGSTGSLSVVNSSDSGNNSLELGGPNTYGGGTTIGPGALIIASSNAALGTGPVTLLSGSGLVTNTGVTLTNPITLQDGSGLAGFGTFSPGGNLTFQNASILDPGRGGIGSDNGTSQVPAPGTLTFGGGTSLTFAGAGRFLFTLTDANGAAGTGYGTVALGTGTLDITATPGNPFYIGLFTYDPTTNGQGVAQNFNPAQAYSWTFLTAASITNFNAADFSFNLSNFQNPIGVGSFYVSENAGDTSLMLNFTPVPEPSTWALMTSGLFAAAAAVRRRRR